jgi:uncharacterized integral membrane protein
VTTVRIIIVFIIGILLIILAVQNTGNTSDIQVFYRTYSSLSLSIIMLYAFGFGVLVAGFFWLVSEIKLRTELRKQKKENEALLSELTALRNLPLEGESHSGSITAKEENI